MMGRAVGAVTRPCLLQPPVLLRSEKTQAFVLERDICPAGGRGKPGSDRCRRLPVPPLNKEQELARTAAALRWKSFSE